jgi:hypothetical protein
VRCVSRLLWFTVLATSPLHALEWEKTRIDVTPEKSAAVVRAKFEFKNPGKKPVQILEVRTACSCIDTGRASSEIAPGAAGTMHVLFTIGKRPGPQEKEIVVLTDDAKEPARLVLKVALPAARDEAR